MISENRNNLINKIELSLIVKSPICSKDDLEGSFSDVHNQYLVTAVNGLYNDVVHSHFVKQLTEFMCDDVRTWCNGIKQKTEQFLESTQHDKRSELLILVAAVSCLELFVQANWTGPPSAVTPGVWTEPKGDKIDEHSADCLAVDGCTVYHKASHASYLLVARTLLENCKNQSTLLTHSWWLLRCLQIQQSLFVERSPTLKSEVISLIDRYKEQQPFLHDNSYRDLAIQFNIEAGHLCYFYYEPARARHHFDTAKSLSGLTVELTGSLGKRTRYQEKDLAQLRLHVSRESSSTPTVMPNTSQTDDIPVDVKLNDDTVLDHINFKDEEQMSMVSLSPVEQAFILGLCYNHRKSVEGQGKIVQEEILAYINYVLIQPQNWCVQTAALLLRSQWEQDSSRLLDRSLSQLEELVNQYRRVKEGSVAHRLHLVYSVQLPPIWLIEKQLAQLFISLGAVNSALEVYLRLEMWEDVIKCYKATGRTEKAEQVIRQQMAIKETPSLWVYLGDVTDDLNCYHQAWKISGERHGAAQRALGLYYMRAQQFDESLPHFEKSLELNPLQIGIWFSYGCSCLATANFEKAATAFRRCVNLDEDNFEAWNNLATAYIKSKNKPRAFMTLQEAVKYNYEDWRVWENYLLVAADVGEFQETIRTYHRLLDLKHSYIDIPVLGVLVKAVVENISDARGEPAERLKPKMLELFGRLTSKVTSKGDIWRLYAEITSGGAADLTDVDLEKVMQYLQKSHRCATQVVGWEKDVDRCLDVCRSSCQLARAYKQCLIKMMDKSKTSQLLSSARFMLKGVVTKINQNIENHTGSSKLDELDQCVSQLKQLLEEFDVHSVLS